jgi:hypothetical protein
VSKRSVPMEGRSIEGLPACVQPGTHLGKVARPSMTAYVRLKMTRPLGMVFISYFGEWA